VRPHNNNPETVSKWQKLAGLVNEKGENASLPIFPNFEDAFSPPVEVNDAYIHTDMPTNEMDEHDIDDPVQLPESEFLPTAPDEREPTSTENVRKSGRVRRMTQRMIESIEQSSNNRAYSTYYEEMHDREYLD